MTARELIAEVRAYGPQDANVIFYLIAERIYKLQLSDGTFPSKISHFKRALEELGDACAPRRANFDSDESWEASRALQLLGPWEAIT